MSMELGFRVLGSYLRFATRNGTPLPHPNPKLKPKEPEKVLEKVLPGA